MTQDTLRQDEFSCSLTVDGRPTPFVWQKSSGGAVDSEGSKSFPGDMLPQKAHGGPKTTEELTLEAEIVPARDMETIEWLESRAGKGDANVTESICDADGNSFQVMNRWTGKLKKVDRGGGDATSANPRVLTVEIETDGK